MAVPPLSYAFLPRALCSMSQPTTAASVRIVLKNHRVQLHRGCTVPENRAWYQVSRGELPNILLPNFGCTLQNTTLCSTRGCHKHAWKKNLSDRTHAATPVNFSTWQAKLVRLRSHFFPLVVTSHTTQGPCVRQRHCCWARRIIICLPAETMATRAPYGGGGAQAGGAADPTTMEVAMFRSCLVFRPALLS